jgi:PAS domain S-box-containing protein
MEKAKNVYQSMVEEIEDYAILLLDAIGNIKNWNRGAEIIKGYKPEEIIGKNFSIFYTAEDAEKKMPEQLMEDARANGKANYEGWRVRKDGTKFWGKVVLKPLYDQKEITGFSKITIDLTEQEKVKQFDGSNILR